MKRIIPLVAILVILLSLFVVPAAAAEGFLEPFMDNSKSSHSDTQYLYEYFKAPYNENPYYTFRADGGSAAHFVGNSFNYNPTTSCNIVLDMYPMGLPNYNETYVSLDLFRSTGRELLSVRIPVVVALGANGKQYSVDVEVFVNLYDSSFKLIKSVDSMELNSVTANGSWAFVDPGHIEIPYSSDVAYFSISVNLVSYVPKAINVKWGLLELKTRSSKNEEITGSQDMQDQADKITGNVSDKVQQGNQAMDALDSVDRPVIDGMLSVPGNFSGQLPMYLSSIVRDFGETDLVYQMLTMAGLVMLASYILFGKKV